MKHSFLLILAVLLLSCNTHKPKEIELVAYQAGLSWDKNDSVFIRVRCKLYAQIKEDGSCILNITDHEKGNRFIRCYINKKILDSIFSLVYKTDSDTSLYKDDKNYFYDGPYIWIVGKNKNEKTIILRFLNSDRSNLNWLKLYKYIDSTSLKPENNYAIDTTKILQAKEKLMKYVYKKNLALWPPINLDKSIRFVPPVIKNRK